MYLNVVVTVLAVLVLLWLLYDVCSRFFYNPAKSLKRMADYSGKNPEYYDQMKQALAAFDKGDFEQVLNICDQMLKEHPYGEFALGFKAYSLYHLKRYTEAKAVFELLETLPNGKDCSRMIEKIKGLG